jgi:SAM-dependent methyltransferase
MPDLSRHSFAAAEVETENLIAMVRELLRPGAGSTVLEIGCGDGATAVALAPEVRSIVGVDLSPENVARASRRAAEAGLSDRVGFAAGDYVGIALPPCDLGFAHGVLHLLPVPDEPLARKLARDIAPGGRLLVTMPFESVGNRAILGARRVLRSLRGPWLDRAMLAAAMAWYRSWPADVLRDRVEYMYLVPPRLDGAAWRAAMSEAGFTVEREAAWPRTSLAKLDHKAVVYRRSDAPPGAA